MGQFSSFSLSAWRSNENKERFLTASEKEEIQDWIFDAGVTDLGCDHSQNNSLIMEFCDTSYYALDNVIKSLSGYADIHPDILFDLTYNCDDDDDHRGIRIKGSQKEEVIRQDTWPSFKILTSPEDHQWSQVCSIRLKPDCFHPECTLTVPVPPDSDPEEYIDQYLDSILSENIRYNAEWEFV